MAENNQPSAKLYLEALEWTNKLGEHAIRSAIKELGNLNGAKILDVPCGAGNHAVWLLEKNPEAHVTGVDIAEAHIAYSRNKLSEAGKAGSCTFSMRDMNRLEFSDDTFDLVWCCDGLWPGPGEIGCPAEEPYNILKDMVRITKDKGKIVVLFWSSQKILPGYPYLEASLNATKSAIMPSPEVQPELHFMSAPAWMHASNMKNIKVKTFAADITAPLTGPVREGVAYLFNMFWGRSEQEAAPDILEKYKDITNPQSDNYILKNENYTVFLTYTMFCGEVNK